MTARGGVRGAPRVALVLDNPQRDLAGLLLTAVELCQHGVDCHLVPATLRARELWALAPDVVLLYHFRKGFEQLVGQLLDAGVRLGVLDNEGGVWPRLATYTDMLIPDAGLRERVRFFCAWGPRVADHLVADGWFSAGQVTPTGCPRFDFYHPRWHALVGEPGGAGDEPPRILVNTNYSEANPRFHSVEVAVRQLCEGFGWPRELADEVVTAQRGMIDATIALIRELARDFPHARIVLRPHPFEGIEVYRERLGDLDGLEINLTGPVQSQLARAAAVIQRTSTTAIETAISGVPALVPLWFPVAAPMPIVESVSVPCESYPAMREVLGRVLAGQDVTTDTLRGTVSAVIADWFHRVDGDAHLRVAERVLANIPSTREVDDRQCAALLHGLDGRRERLARRVPRLARRQLGLPPEWSFRRLRFVPPTRWLDSDQRFTATEAQAMADRIVRQRVASGERTRPVRALPTHLHPGFTHRFPTYSVAVVAERSAAG